MYAVQFLYILALSIMFIATYTAYGFTINAIPNLIYIIILVVVEISTIFAMIKQWALLIIPFIILIVRFIEIIISYFGIEVKKLSTN